MIDGGYRCQSVPASNVNGETRVRLYLRSSRPLGFAPWSGLRRDLRIETGSGRRTEVLEGSRSSRFPKWGVRKGVYRLTDRGFGLSGLHPLGEIPRGFLQSHVKFLGFRFRR